MYFVFSEFIIIHYFHLYIIMQLLKVSHKYQKQLRLKVWLQMRFSQSFKQDQKSMDMDISSVFLERFSPEHFKAKVNFMIQDFKRVTWVFNHKQDYQKALLQIFSNNLANIIFRTYQQYSIRYDDFTSKVQKRGNFREIFTEKAYVQFSHHLILNLVQFQDWNPYVHQILYLYASRIQNTNYNTPATQTIKKEFERLQKQYWLIQQIKHCIQFTLISQNLSQVIKNFLKQKQSKQIQQLSKKLKLFNSYLSKKNENNSKQTSKNLMQVRKQIFKSLQQYNQNSKHVQVSIEKLIEEYTNKYMISVPITVIKYSNIEYNEQIQVPTEKVKFHPDEPILHNNSEYDLNGVIESHSDYDETDYYQSTGFTTR